VYCTDGAQVECQTVTGTGDSITFVPADPEDEETFDHMVLVKTGAGFGSQDVKTVTISGASNPANNGTFPVLEVSDGDTIVYGNPDGVTEGSFAGTFTVDPVTVTGANDQQVGDLAAGAWPSVPFNVVDVFAGTNPNTTGTGARLFNK
jgi:hypothetical protein